MTRCDLLSCYYSTTYTVRPIKPLEASRISASPSFRVSSRLLLSTPSCLIHTSGLFIPSIPMCKYEWYVGYQHRPATYVFVLTVFLSDSVSAVSVTTIAAAKFVFVDSDIRHLQHLMCPEAHCHKILLWRANRLQFSGLQDKFRAQAQGWPGLLMSESKFLNVYSWIFVALWLMCSRVGTRG